MRETGRGYPNIESLKAIAKFFGVTVDDLLSGDELLTLAEENTRQRENRIRDLVFGLLDSSVALFFFLPLFGQEINGLLQEVSLLSLTEIAPYLRWAYFAVVFGMIALGILILATQCCRSPFWDRNKLQLSLLLNGAGALVFIMSSQPYGAALLFVFLIIKAFVWIKRQ